MSQKKLGSDNELPLLLGYVVGRLLANGYAEQEVIQLVKDSAEGSKNFEEYGKTLLEAIDDTGN